MGIQPEVARFIEAMQLPKGFSVCELGDQGMCGEPTKRLARDWYLALGCGLYLSIDGNGRGSVTADLNEQLDGWIGQFDLVTDFGTGEHIFDQAQVWRTMHQVCKPGGYIAVDRPSAGYETHCFYITNELLYRDIAAANGYEVIWLEQRETPRGKLIGGCFKKAATDSPFRIPQQGRYKSELVIAQ